MTALHKKSIFLLVAAFFLLSLGSDLFAQRLIDRIIIYGNKSTKEEVIRRLSGLERYQEITRALLKESRASIMSSELFEEVKIRTADPTNGNKKAYSNILIKVKEKIFWFAAPIFQFSADSIGGGLVYGNANLFGYNKKALGLVQYGDVTKQGFLAYRDPSLFGTNFILEVTGIGREQVHSEYKSASKIRELTVRDFGGKFMPGYSWGPLFTTSIGIDWRWFHYHDHKILDTDAMLTPFYPNIQAWLGQYKRNIALRIEFEFNRMKSHQGLKDGQTVKLVSEISDKRFWSEYDYFLEELHITIAKRLFKTQNLTYSMTAALGSGLTTNEEPPVQTLPYHKLMVVGGLGLRGYRTGEMRGDTEYRHSIEYLYKLFDLWKLVFRGIVFWDSGLVFFKDSEISQDNFKNGIGGGLRMYVKNVVIPLMGLDIGYGIERNDYQIYFNIGKTF